MLLERTLDEGTKCPVDSHQAFEPNPHSAAFVIDRCFLFIFRDSAKLTLLAGICEQIDSLSELASIVRMFGLVRPPVSNDVSLHLH
jgi:hypothetical protein